MGRTRGEPNEIELPSITPLLDGSLYVRVAEVELRRRVALLGRHLPVLDSLRSVALNMGAVLRLHQKLAHASTRRPAHHPSKRPLHKKVAGPPKKGKWAKGREDHLEEDKAGGNEIETMAQQ